MMRRFFIIIRCDLSCHTRRGEPADLADAQRLQLFGLPAGAESAPPGDLGVGQDVLVRPAPIRVQPGFPRVASHL